MARKNEWKDDQDLLGDLKSYVAQNFKRLEVLDFVKRDCAQYEWSLATLARRLKEFGIKYIDYTIEIETIRNAVREEIDGPGKLLGYRAMNLKLRTEHSSFCVCFRLVF